MPARAKVRLSGEALADLDRVRRFLALANPAVVPRMRETLGRVIDRLSDSPQLGRPWPNRPSFGDVRELVVPFGRNAYILRYLAEPGWITILRIHHSREDRSAVDDC